MAEGWEIRRRVARFRGIPLQVLSSSRSGGRRLDVHEFAGREDPFAEDLGRSAVSISVRGIFIGEAHDLDADRLRRAFDQAGAGELVLPHSAPISVAVASYQIEEAAGEAGAQRFDVEFVEAGYPATPSRLPDWGGRVATSLAGVLDAVGNRFSGAFGIAGAAAATVEAGQAVANGAAAAIGQAVEKTRAISELVDDLDDVVREVDSLTSTISGQIVDAALGAAAFRDTLEAIGSLPLAPLEVFNSLADVAKYGAALVDPGSGTVARKLQKTNQDELAGMVRKMASGERAKLASKITFSSSTQAAAVRDEIAAELAVEIKSASDALDDVSASALRQLRAAIIRDIDTRAARLPQRVEWRPEYVASSLAISQRLYGTPDRALEIVARNPVAARYPSRISSASPLEVLSK